MAKRKETTTKKNKKEIINNTSYNNEFKSVIKCIIGVLLFFGIMYLLTLLILKKSSTDYIEIEDEKTAVQYTEILAGTSFDKEDKEYLVMFYDQKEDKNSTYYTMISDYQAKDSHLPIYYVNLANAMNKNIISTDNNKNATNAEELKVAGPTLIKFADNSIKEFIEGKEEIDKYLKS